jgi:RNA polymerase sigma factor (sigma-70 family)
MTLMPQFVRFLTTVWTTIERAKKGDKDSIEKVVKKYSNPLRAFIRNRGLGETDADDILQEVLIRITDEGFLAKADKMKGKFRSVLLGVTNNVILKHYERARALKRGGDAKTLSLETLRKESDAELNLPAAEQEDFNKLWFDYLLKLSLQKLQQESAASKKPYYKILQFRIRELSYHEIAQQLRMSESDVANYLHYAKKKVYQFARELIADYSSSQTEFEDEVDLFVKTMQG